MLAREGIGIQRLPAPVKPSLPQRSFVDRVLARLEADLRAAEEARDEANIRWMQATCRGEGDASDDRRLAYYQAVATCDRINHDINLIQDEAAR